jgi:DNA-binding NarL/FixJ family response regulator
MEITVLLALNSTIYSEGIKLLLSNGSDEGVKFVIYDLSSLGDLKPDIILTDGSGLDLSLLSAYAAKVVIIDNGLSNEDIIFLATSCRVDGFISPNHGVKLFQKALVLVSQGEAWIDNHTLRCLLNLRGANASRKKGDLFSERERQVVDHVCAGYANKEVASKLNISEQTVKAHLNRIFRKLGITSRSQLIAITLKNNRILTSSVVTTLILL